MSSNTSECLSAAYKVKTTLSYRIKKHLYYFLIKFTTKIHLLEQGELW